MQNTTAAIKRIDIATDGALQAQKDLVTALQSTKATTAEIAARLAVSPPVTGTWHFTQECSSPPTSTAEGPHRHEEVSTTTKVTSPLAMRYADYRTSGLTPAPPTFDVLDRVVVAA